MKKTLITTIAVCGIAFASYAQDIQQEFDAYLASSNFNKCVEISNKKLIPLDIAIGKAINKAPIGILFELLKSQNANVALISQVVNSIDVDAAIATQTDRYHLASIVRYNDWILTEDGQRFFEVALSKNPYFAAGVSCNTWWKIKQDVVRKSMADATLAACIANLNLKSSALPYEVGSLCGYSMANNDTSSFNAIYDSSKLDLTHHWYVWPTTSKIVYKNYMIDYFAAAKRLNKTHSARNDRLMIAAKRIDMMLSDNNASKEAYTEVTTTKAKFDVAFQANDIDLILDALLNCDDTLEASDIEKTIAPINALAPTYKTELVKNALKAVNQRYTLKLYNDHATWEPILSKIRAMIEVRQNY